MAQTKIQKTELGPLGIVDADVAGISLNVLTQSGAALNDVPRWNGENFVPAAIAGLSQHVDAETPVGIINNSNKIFTLAFAPNPASSLQLFKNGVLLRVGAGNDYTLSGVNVTLTVAPGSNDVLLAYYRR